MLTAALVLGAIGLVSALMLGVAAKLFAVYVDPNVTAIEDELPGANCGGCGYAGCSACAEAMAKGKAPANACIVGGDPVAAMVAAIMGVAVGASEKLIAEVGCRYGVDKAAQRYVYAGIHDCRAEALIGGGVKECPIGCLGLGSCSRACPFHAITMSDEGLPVVDADLCTGCGACVRICPKDIIQLHGKFADLQTVHCHEECTAPCQRTCPAQINIPAYIQSIADGQYEQAVRIIKERNPLPLTCGRVCPHPCEDECRRNLVDEPVNINHLKRFASDYEMNSGKRIKYSKMPPSGRRVAIIGGGPGGLTAAFYLSRLGHKCTIFEAQPKLGGMLRYGIPQYRLPKSEVLDWEIQSIIDMGVEVHLETKLGRDFTMESLKAEGYDAVLVAIGAWGSRNMRVEGEDLEGVSAGTDFLINRGLEQETPIGERVVIVGGGNTALDCARTSWRLGAKEVTVLYRRTRKEMPANDIEVVEANHEEVKFHYLAAPTGFDGEGGMVKALEFIRMELGEPDASGRRRPVPVEDSETKLPVDTVFAAIGQFPDLECLSEGDSKVGPELELTRWNSIIGDEVTMQTNVSWIFTAGDCRRGAATAVEAIGDGRKAATGIHLFLQGLAVEPITIKPGGTPYEQGQPIVNISSPADVHRVERDTDRIHMNELGVEERRLSFVEVETGLVREQAQREAERCLDCGLICYRQTEAADERGVRKDQYAGSFEDAG
jgi:formate dehydrogenase (NADP+) beta subunit